MSKDKLELRLLELPTEDPTDAANAEQKAWAGAVEQGFNGKKQTDDQWAKLSESYRAEQRRIRGIYHDAPEGSVGGPVATFGSYDASLNTGGGHVEPANLITDVTVRATHRRRGLLRRMMTEDLTQAQQRGMTFATLTATEATIYGRFGFGAATVHRRVEMDVKRGLALRHSPAGTVEVLDGEHPSVIGAWERLFDHELQTRRGAHARPPYYTERLSGSYDFEEEGPNRKLRTAGHYSPSGELDGLVTYQINDWKKVFVSALIGLTADAELALWEYLGNLDLIEELTFFGDDPANPLPWAMVDSRQYKIVGQSDCIWLRVLDVPRALAIRGWESDGELVLQVDDPMGLSQTRVRLQVVAGQATVTATEDEADVTLTIETLGSLYFGQVRAKVLAAAGRIEGTDQALTTLSTLFEVAVPPFNQSHF